MTAPHVAVVGGGLAGLTAALSAADDGARVTLLESSPRLGGAASSYARDGWELDNGQHVFLGCCTAYRALLARLGVTGLTVLQDRLDVSVLRPGRRPVRLRAARLPAPLHLGAALAGYGALPLSVRLRAGLAALAAQRLDPTDEQLDGHTFGAWLRAQRQPEAARTALWDLLSVAALNTSADEASLAWAAFVLRTALLAGPDAAGIGWSTVPLARLHADPAAQQLQALGVQVHTRRRVRAVHPDADGAVLVTEAGPLRADRVVLAVPQRAAATLLPAAGLPPGPPSAPIVDLHVVYDRPVTTLPFAAGIGSPVQWVFDRTASSGLTSGQYLAVSLSAARRWVDEPVPALRAAFLPALAELLPGARGATVTKFVVTRERTATPMQGPGTAHSRPGTRTLVPHVLLAGAWTDTGWPATMESAVRSGQIAARAALADAEAASSPVRAVGRR